MPVDTHIQLPLQLLLDELATLNFVLGTDMRLRVAQFVNRNFEKIETVEAWKLHLAAILCSSVEQQNAFYETFDRFFDRITAQNKENIANAAAKTELETPTAPPPPPPPVQTEKETKLANTPTAIATKGRSGPIRIDLQFPTNPLRIWNIADVNRAVRPLIEKEWSPVEEWDIPLSIRNTIHNGGVPSFVKRRRKVAPQYLMLIEQQSARDHLSRFYAELAQELSRRDMSVEYYFYDFIPDRCWRNRREPSSYTYVERLATEYADAKLLIVGRPDGLLNLPDFYPSNLTLDLLDKFKAVALLCNKSTGEWGNAELALCQLFPVVPANAEGLATLIYQWDAPSVFTPTYWQMKYPEPTVPPTRRTWDSEEDIKRDLADLRFYLGRNGFNWLCAAAVYPEIYYELTSLLNDETIKPNADMTEYDQNRVWHIALLRLCRVRWFREGHIPTEVRQLLRDVLPVEQAQAVRSQLLKVLALVKDKVPKDSYAAANLQFTTALYGFEKNTLGKSETDVLSYRRTFEDETHDINISEIDDALGRQFFFDNQVIIEDSALRKYPPKYDEPPKIEHFAFPTEPKERGFYVLWVDDKPSGNQSVMTALRESVKFTTALNTEGGIKSAKENYFDVLISDIGRPESQTAGIDLMKQLREMGFDKPIALFSAGYSDREGLMAQGATFVSNNTNELKEWISKQAKVKKEQHQTPLTENLVTRTEAVIKILIEREDDKNLLRLIEATDLDDDAEGISNILSQLGSIRMRKGSVRQGMQGIADRFLGIFKEEKTVDNDFEEVLSVIEKEVKPKQLTVKELKEQVKNLVATAKTDLALDTFILWANIANPDLTKNLTLLKAQLTKLKRDENLGLISFSEANMKRSQITNSILSLLDELKEETDDLIDAKKDIINQYISFLQTGSEYPDYSLVNVYADGKNSTRQITYGSLQTTEQGNLKDLIAEYIKNKGKYGNDFQPYLPKIGVESLADDTKFIELLKKAGKEDPIMGTTQESLFDTAFYQPAFKFFKENGFTYPLSLLVIYDSYVQSGNIPASLRNQVTEKIPKDGGDEKAWITAYTNARHEWLRRKFPAFQKTMTATNTFLNLMAQDRWDIGTAFSRSDILMNDERQSAA